MPIRVRRSGDDVDALAGNLRQFDDLGDDQQDQRDERAEADLEHDLGEEELGVHHEIQAAERFVGLVDAVNQVEHLQAEVDDEGVEEVHRDGVDAAHVDRLAGAAW